MAYEALERAFSILVAAAFSHYSKVYRVSNTTAILCPYPFNSCLGISLKLLLRHLNETNVA